MFFTGAPTSVDLGIQQKYSWNMYLLRRYIRWVWQWACCYVTVQSVSQKMETKQTEIRAGKLLQAFYFTTQTWKRAFYFEAILANCIICYESWLWMLMCLGVEVILTQ